MEIFNTVEYDNIVEKMRKCVEYYEKIDFKNNKYSLYLANGDILSIKFSLDSIAHLLGLKVEVFKKYNLVKGNISSYDCLKYFIDNSFSILQKLRKEKIPYETLFSKYVNEKLDAFINNINIRNDDLEFIIKYDSEKIYQFEEHSEISDYYIVRKIKGKYHVLGLVNNLENTKFYKATSSRQYDSVYELNKFIERISKKQDLTYCHLLKISNNFHSYESSFVLSIDNKMELLKNIINLSKKFDCVASVASDYLFSINKSKTDRVNTNLNIEILKLLSDSIKSGNVLDRNTLTEVCGEIEITEDLMNLINICNDLVCLSESSNDLAQDNYSKVSEENSILKQELELLKKQLREQEEKNNELSIQNNELREENNNYKKDMNILSEAYQKVFKK